MKDKIILLSGILIITFNSVYSQTIKNFSDIDEKFIAEFEDFMTRNISKEDEKFIDQFVEDWSYDSAFLVDKHENIIKLCNLLLDKKSRPFPDFKIYLDVIYAFKNNPKEQKHYKNWEESMFFLYNQRKISRTSINGYLTNLILLFEQLSLHKSSYADWKVTSKDFKIVVEDKKLKIKFENTSIVCYSKKDSINFYDTRGWYDPLEIQWNGEGGMVTWERAGYNRDDVNAVLYTYTINMKRSEYFAENVRFTNKFYFERPLTGRLHDAVRLIKEPSVATYPQFDSYTKVFRINDFYENIDFIGGLSMRGAKLIGIGNERQKATLFLYNNDTLFMRASSKYFAFTSDKVTGRNTEVTLLLEQDSIFHPDLLLNYEISKKELTLNRTDDYTSQGPYFNSYHKVDMNFEQLTWRYGEPYLLFTMSRGATIGNANFESVNFFNMDRFNSIQLIDPVHPLVQLRRYSKIAKTNDFYGEEFANYMKLPLQEVKRLLMRLSFLGFVFYNFETDEVTVKEKLIAYLEASVNRRDYDVINFESVTYAPQENAVLNLNDFDLTINGMPQVFISDSQNVHIFPLGNRIIMKRNRSFQFDGKVDAGLFTFWGNNFFFNYDSFSISLQNIDSIQIRYLTDERDNYGFKIIGKVENMIEHVTGDLLVDDPDNKSGRENFAQYPIFRSREKSYVYYDEPYIQSGVYKHEDFYFHLDPFEIDSLDNFDVRGLSFEGTFYSADIFPVFNETLKLQEDQSLGFKHTTEEEGIPAYKGKGTYKELIQLSNRGLRGKGTLEYITSVTKSDDFIFLPDSMNTYAKEFAINKQTTGTQYPMLKSTDNYIHWEPYNDSWMAYQKEAPFTIYNDTTTLSGTIHLQPEGLTGSGKLDMTRAILSSEKYNFLADDFHAKTAGFELRSLLTGTSVKTDSVNVHIDYISRKGSFLSENDFARIDYPENKYITYVDQFTWIMDKEELEFRKIKSIPTVLDTDEELTGSTYLSTDPLQDSLNFVSPFSVYNYKKNVLNAKDVEYFYVADAKLFPDKGDVYIEPNGAMRTLINAKSEVNTQTKYHKMHSATFTVVSRIKYYGLAKYDYIDENDEVQVINMNQVEVDDSLYTFALGNIIEEDDFKINPYLKFQGRVHLHSTEKYLTFKGATQILHDCESLPPLWLTFKTVINPDSVYIPVSGKMKDINGNFIFAGSMIRSDSIHVYPAFFSKWQNYSDNPITTAEGYLHYDKGGNRYKISSVEKMNDFNIPGNYLSLNRSLCELYGEGKVDLNINLGQVELTSVGNTRHDVEKNHLKLDVMLGVDFHIRDDIIALTGMDIDSIVETKPVDITTIRIKKGFYELMGIENTEKYLSELSMIGVVEKFPEELYHTIFFNDVRFEWNRVTRSYQSIGRIGVGNILNNQINKYVEGFIEIDRKRSGDKMDIYLEIDEHNWYYFGYTRGVMQVISSNSEFIELVRNLKNKERRSKIKGLKTPYNIIVSTDRKYALFVRRWKEVLEERKNEE